MKRSVIRVSAALSAALLSVLPASHAMAAPAELAVPKSNPPFVTAFAIIMGACALVALGAYIARLWKKD